MLFFGNPFSLIYKHLFCITLHAQGDDQQSDSLGRGAAACAYSSLTALGSPGELAQLASVLAENPVVASIFDRSTALFTSVSSVSESAAQPTIEPKVRAPLASDVAPVDQFVDKAVKDIKHLQRAVATTTAAGVRYTSPGR